MAINRKQAVQAARKVTLIGSFVNLFNFVIKLVVGIWASSSALVADAIHSLSDLLSDLLVLVATHWASQKPDADHPYGHERYETLATLLLGSILIAVAGALMWDSFSRLFTSSELTSPHFIALFAALFSIISKEWIYRYTLKVAQKINSRLLEANAWHHRSDALSSVVVLVAVAGSMLGLGWLDQLAAVIVGVMVGKMGAELIWESMQELVDTALPEEETTEIKRFALQVAGVKDVHDLRSRKMGSRTILDLHLEVAPYLSVSEGHEIGVWVAKTLKENISHISDVTVHIDPEDDTDIAVEKLSPRQLLPLRPDILAVLNRSWRDDPEFELPHFTTLHYLESSIDVDLFYSAHQLDISRIADLEARLKQKTEQLTWLREVKVWVGNISQEPSASNSSRQLVDND